MLLNAIYAQIAVLTLAGLWLAFVGRRSGWDSSIKIAAIALLLLGLWLGGVWVYPPPYGLLAAAILFSILLVRHFHKPAVTTPLWRSILAGAPALFFGSLGGYLLYHGATGRLEPSDESIALSSPFRSENAMCVLSGGLTPLLNFHNFPSDSPRDIGQTYGLDIIAIGPSGFRTVAGQRPNPKPENKEHYAIYGEAVFAPCDGKVVEYENGLPDLRIGQSDKINTGGNGVVLQCGRHHVHLHHLKQGSVLLQLGDMVRTGEKIGEIGNSGNTIEPHLHLHAETVVEKGNSRRHGEPVHMQIDERYLARGDCL